MVRFQSDSGGKKSSPDKPRGPRKHIAALKKRAAHLEKRIAASTDRRLTYDEAELAALRWALSKLERGVD